MAYISGSTGGLSAWLTPSRRRSNRRGGALVEVAITLAIVLNLTFGMVEFGYYFYCKNLLEGAAREGTRAAIVAGAVNSDVTTAVANALASANWNSTYYTVKITDTSNNTLNLASAAVGTQVQVNVIATWSKVGAGFRPLNLIGSSKQLLGFAVMRKEG